MKIFLIYLFILISCFNPAYCNEVSIVDNCRDARCLSATISDIATSNDENFFLVAYKSSDRFIRKINANLSVDSLITFDNSSGENVSFKVLISSDNNKALIYSKEINSSLESIFYILNLQNNTTQKISVNSIKLNALLFFDKTGDSILATNNDVDDSKLVVVNSMSGEIEKTFSLPDVGDVLALSPTEQDAIVLFKNILFQSLDIFDVQKEKLIRIDLPLSIIFKTDEFLERIKFNENGAKAVLSSLDGIHVLYFVDLIKNKLIVKKLFEKSTGKVLSTVSKDGSFIVSVGLDKEKRNAILYKVNAKNIKKLKILQKITLDNIKSVSDILISPDNENIFILSENKLLVLKLSDLSNACEENLDVSLSNKQFFSNINSLNVFIPSSDDRKINKVSVSNFCSN